MGKAALLLEYRLTEVPLLGAAPLRVRVTVAVAPETTDVGAMLSAVSVSGVETGTVIELLAIGPGFCT
jgi:hypothetical protein